jgi:class 3 adenylate cyclase
MQKNTYRIEVEAAIDQVLLEQARQNELKLAYARACVLVLSAVLDLVCYFHPSLLGLESAPILNSIFSGSWSVVAVALVLALRRGWYRPWMRTVLPVMDGVLIGAIFINLWRTLMHSSQSCSPVLINVAAVCSLLAVSGVIRLTRVAAIVTTAMAIANYALLCVLFRLDFAMAAFAGFSILAAGMLGMWMTEIVRRQMQSETGRTIIERLLPKRVVEQAFRDPLGLLEKAQTCHVTVLVSDLRGFTSYSEKLPPEHVFRFLNDIQGTLAKIVREYGGTVDKFMGDGMLAVFGAPEPLDDHQQRAIQAAEAMHQAMVGREVKLGIGVHSGPVVAGCLGSGAKIEFTVIGDTVNVASRIESLTKEKGVPVLVSADTVRGTSSRLEPIGEVTVRGRTEPLVLHALVR